MGVKTKIDWADATWNPVTGCLHGCEYCYARRMVNRFSDYNGDFYLIPSKERNDGTIEKPLFVLNERHYKHINGDKPRPSPYPFGFVPTFHRYKLDEPQKWKKGRNIFVCSMADLFGEWIPDEWIEEVFAACEKAPQHNYLFLTKNPKRYEEILDRHMPPNMWFGWTQIGPSESGFTFSTHHSVNTFASIEPLLKPFDKFYPDGIGWVIIGAETGNRTRKVIPKREWIENIVDGCGKAEIPVFMKESLAEIWGEPLIQEYPKGLMK